MTEATDSLPPEARAILAEEEALLARARASLARALDDASHKARGGADLRSVDALREIRDEAASAKLEDLPALLLELSVRQKLLERSAVVPLPDPLSPYLAHLRVDEGKGERDYLLGHVSFLDPDAGVRIVDWRLAPVAQIFYRYREGEEYEEPFPGRVAEGVVTARRIVVLTAGRLTQIVGDRLVLTRLAGGAWVSEPRAALSFEPGGAGSAQRSVRLGEGFGPTEPGEPGQARHSGTVQVPGLASGRFAEVTALLDADQFAAVCAPPEEPLLVLGTAGSGKTTVALHRLARIAAREPARYPLARMSVVVPEEGLARLSRRLLEPLGVGRAQVHTLDDWAYQLARAVFGVKLPRLNTDAPALVVGLKRHPAFFRALERRFARPGHTTLKGLRRRLYDALSDRALLEQVVAASAGSLPAGAVDETLCHTRLQLAEPIEKELADIVVGSRKQSIDGLEVAEGTPEDLAGTLDVEDLPILLAMKAWREGLDVEEPLAHLVMDEAEDVSLFELLVAGRLLGDPRSVTLAGDEAQQTLASFAGWKASLATLGVGKASTCRLEISYRCPLPVVELARRVLGPLAPEATARAAREGPPVGVHHFPGDAQAQLFLAGAVRDLVGSEPRASVAIIARDAAAARRFHEQVADLPEARLVLDGAFSFEPGVDVTDVAGAKGLEFDYVLVPDATEDAYPDNDEARRRLHVAITRTAHQLWVVSGGPPSPLLA